MTTVKAQVAKEKGNAAFKAGDYPTAIGHYTTAILADRYEPIFPLNRAAAYLKLGKYDDAAKDCSTVLALDPSNVKALFRRGQAKVGMNKLSDAQNDYKEALRLEPANESIKLEVNAVGKLIEQPKQSKSDHSIGPSFKPSASFEVLPKRRRIPINILEPVNPLTPTNKSIQDVGPDFLKPISSRPLNSPVAISGASSAAATMLRTSPTLSTFKDAKQTRENARPSRTGGGIFRQSGNHTIFSIGTTSSTPSVQQEVKTRAPPAETSSFSFTKPSMTLFDFTRSWESLSSAKERWLLVSSIPPSSLPAMFQTSLEPSLLVSFLETFRTILDHDQGAKVQIWEYMGVLANIPRFNTVWLFLGETEKEHARDIWRKLGKSPLW